MGKDYPRRIKKGFASCKIYREKHRESFRYAVLWFEKPGDPIRKRFSQEREAEQYAREVAERLNLGEIATQLTPGDRNDFLQARQLLARNNLNLTVTQSVTQLVELHQAGYDGCGFADLLSIINQSPQQCGIVEKTIPEICDELVENRRQGNYSASYVKSLIVHFRRFSRDFQTSITYLHGPTVQRWLSRLELSPKSEKNYLQSITTLVGFAKKMGYFPSHLNPLEHVSPAKDRVKDVEIFSANEMEKYLSTASEDLMPYLILGAFSGLRTSEIQRLDWSDIGDDFITVAGTKSKTAKRRLIPVSDNLKAWFRIYRKPNGMVIRLRNLAAELSKWFKNNPKLPKWKHNALRHSFCSYRLAVIQNVAQVSLEAGNSPQVFMNHYRELVTPKEGNQWFSIKPPEGDGPSISHMKNG